MTRGVAQLQQHQQPVADVATVGMWLASLAFATSSSSARCLDSAHIQRPQIGSGIFGRPMLSGLGMQSVHVMTTCLFADTVFRAVSVSNGQ